MAFSLG